MCEQVFGSDSMSYLFESDQKKYVIALDRITLMIEENPDELMQVIDVVFKWVYIKLDENENDRPFIIKIYDFLVKLFEFLKRYNYVLQDNEAFVIIPMLCANSGHNNTIVKNKIKVNFIFLQL